MKRAIFPLPLFILPDGYTRLRIFEPRYLTMVKNALKDETGFVLCAFEHHTPLNVSPQGCLMDIIDFDQDDNGMLLIDIKAIKSVQIEDSIINEDELRFGTLTDINTPFWYNHDTPITGDNAHLANALRVVFEQNEDLKTLYRNTYFEQLPWVAARWLELLPISIEKKQQLAFETSFEKLQNFLHTVITE
jgi:Lon protease-like protein